MSVVRWMIEQVDTELQSVVNSWDVKQAILYICIVIENMSLDEAFECWKPFMEILSQ